MSMYNFGQVSIYEEMLQVWQQLTIDMGEVEGERFYIREAEAMDVAMLDLREEQRDMFNGKDIDYCIRLHAHLKIVTPMNYTMFYGDKMMVMMSVVPQTEQCAEISFLTDNNMPEASKRVKFNLIKVFRQALSLLPFRRIQAKVKSDFDIGKRFVAGLGFTEECLLKCYGPNDTDYYHYGLILDK